MYNPFQYAPYPAVPQAPQIIYAQQLPPPPPPMVTPPPPVAPSPQPAAAPPPAAAPAPQPAPQAATSASSGYQQQGPVTGPPIQTPAQHPQQQAMTCGNQFTAPPPPSQHFPPPQTFFFENPPPSFPNRNRPPPQQMQSHTWEHGSGWTHPNDWNNEPPFNHWGRNQNRSFQSDAPPLNSNWGSDRPPRNNQRFSNNGEGGPIRGNPKNQNPRSNPSRPPPAAQPKPYDRPPQKPTQLKQLNMPYFETVEGEFTQLCVFAAQDQECPNAKCKFSHEPRERRVCPLFHNPAERCSHNPCLLGHHEARGAYRASKAFKACKRLAAHKTNEELAIENEDAESGAKGGEKVEANQTPGSKPAPANNLPGQLATLEAIKPKENTVPGGNASPVNFETLAQEKAQLGQTDEVKRLYQITEQLQSQFEALKKETTEKDTQVRTLQTAMGDITAENASLRQENESKSPILDAYYKDVFENRSNTRQTVDLNMPPPSDVALEGSLAVLNTMMARPLEFSSECKILDLFNHMPQTKFSNDVQSLQSLGLSAANTEHAFL